MKGLGLELLVILGLTLVNAFFSGDLGRLHAYSVMVPRSEVAWLSLEASRAKVLQILRDAPHARYPVLDADQQPIGYVVTHEVYAQLLDGDIDLRGLLRDIPIFPKQAPAVDVLRALQGRAPRSASSSTTAAPPPGWCRSRRWQRSCSARLPPSERRSAGASPRPPRGASTSAATPRCTRSTES